MRLVYRVISCDELGGSIACTWNSQMASSLSQIHLACSITKMLSFPLEIEKNIWAIKSYRFLQWRWTRDRRNPHGQLPDFCLAQISPLLWSFSRFWWSFIGIEVLNEEEYSILCILYCYSLHQHIFLAFCNDFDTHYRIFPYILLRNKTLLFPKWSQKLTRPILRYSSVVNMEMCKILNFENSYKINKNSYNDNFFAVVIRR